MWRLVSRAASALARGRAAHAADGEAGAVSKAAHKALKAAGEDIGKLGFNKAVARIYELSNVLQAPLAAASAGEADEALKGALREAVEFLLSMIAPMMPHLAEECWAELGGQGMIAEACMAGLRPGADGRQRDRLPLQINGKKRGDLTIARDADQAAVEKAALALDVVRKALEGKQPRKVIVVPQRIVNAAA